MLLAALLPLATEAAPFAPADDAQVIETFPAGLRPDVLRRMAGSETRDPTVAAVLARTYIQRARAEADPRMLGYAQGVLAPWWDAPQAPAEIVLLRATIKQARHEFAAALVDLDEVLRQKPDSAQAWLTRATVLRVQGRFAEAAEACAQLRGRADPFVAELCSHAVAGMSGALGASVDALAALRPRAGQQPAEVQSWFAAEYADMLERSGRNEQARDIYQDALTRTPGDHALRAAYADLLLDNGQAAQVVQLTTGYERVDALRLREVIARAYLGESQDAEVAALAAGFEAAHRRNEELHLREEARFTLEVRQDPAKALALAQRNWTVQHEPWDVRLLLAAAVAAHRPLDAAPAIEWLESSHLEDARIAALRTQAQAR